MWKKIICSFLLLSHVIYAAPYHFSLQTVAEKTEKTITEKDFPGKYLLLAIGYTSCPDICPTTLYEIGALMKRQDFGEKDKVQPLFVSIDPLRDTPERISAYTKYFHPQIVGLSGKLTDVEALMEQLNASFGYRFAGKKVTPPNLPPNYEVYHSTYLYLLSPERELIDVYDYNAGAASLAKSIDRAIAADEAAKSEVKTEK